MSKGQVEPDLKSRPPLRPPMHSGWQETDPSRAAEAPIAAASAQAPQLGPKPEYATFWQLLIHAPALGLRWLVAGGPHANFFRAPVRWLFGRDLLVSMRSIALYSAFGDELDHRDWMQAQVNDLRHLPCEEGAFWFDYVSDTGDGQLAMYDMASLLLSDLYVTGAASPGARVDWAPESASAGASTRLPRGRVLFFGGDTAYHVADTATLESRLSTPFAWALAEARADSAKAASAPAELDTSASSAPDARYAFGIPGNHDYYDSLIGFNRLFRANTPLLPLADFERLQRASFVALRLPYDYLFLGLDSQKGKLDRRQRRFMRQCLADFGSDRLIVATPEPTTVFDHVVTQAAQVYADLELPRPFLVAQPQAGEPATAPESRAPSTDPRAPEAQGPGPDFPPAEQLHLDIAGDVHHYARYADPDHPNYASVVAGGGGAFFHPSHTSHQRPGAAWPPIAAAKYPSPADSRRVINARLLCPWRIFRGGGVFLLGALFALLVYLGVALSPDIQRVLLLERAENATATWELGSAVAQNLERLVDRDGSGAAFRGQLTPWEWLTLLFTVLVIAWASVKSPPLFRIATAREEAKREVVHATRYAPMSTAALLCLCLMALTYYVLAGQAAPPLRPFKANFLLFAYLLPFPLSLLWVANYLATQSKQAKLRLMHAIDSAPRWVAVVFGTGSAVFGLLSYGVNSVAAFATDLAALSAALVVAVAPMIFGYVQGAGRSLGLKLGYLALGALFGQLQLLLPLAICVYGSALTCLLSASAAVAIAYAAYAAQLRWTSPWLMLGFWLLAGGVSLALALSSAALRPVDGASFGLAAAAGGTFACLWFGYYLAVSLGFGAHNNEAGGAARADFYRHFVRFKLEPDRITGYVIGFDRPAFYVRDARGNAATQDVLRPHVIERFELTRAHGTKAGAAGESMLCTKPSPGPASTPP